MKKIDFQVPYSERERRRLFKLLLALFGLSLLYIAFSIFIYYIHPTLLIYVLTLGGAIILAPGLKEAYAMVIRNYRKNKKGVGGEGKVRKILDNELNDDYTYISNYVLPGKIGDIDAILIGPKGLFILEIKAWNGRFRVEEQSIYRDVAGRKPILCKDVIGQVRKQKKDLEKYLNGKGIVTTITPMAVFTLGIVDNFKGKTKVWITDESRLLKDILRDNNKTELSHEFCQHVVNALINELKEV